MSTRLYFAYGSNLHPTRLMERIPSARLVARARLDGHVLRYHKRGACGSGKCNAFYTGDSRDHVLGAAYRLSQHEKHRLDTFEGEGYLCRDITIEMDGGRDIAFAYIAVGHFIDNALQPYAWYHALVTAGARYLAFPESYIANYLDVNTQADPDRERRARHMELLARMERAMKNATHGVDVSLARNPARR